MTYRSLNNSDRYRNRQIEHFTGVNRCIKLFASLGFKKLHFGKNFLNILLSLLMSSMRTNAKNFKILFFGKLYSNLEKGEKF